MARISSSTAEPIVRRLSTLEGSGFELSVPRPTATVTRLCRDGAASARGARRCHRSEQWIARGAREPARAAARRRGGDLTGEAAFAQIEFATDSPLEGDGFELSVPRQIGYIFRASSEMGPIDRRRGGGIRAVAGLGNRSNVGGHSKSCCSPPNQATPRCRQGAHIAEPEVRIQLSALSADQKTLGIPPF